MVETVVGFCIISAIIAISTVHMAQPQRTWQDVEKEFEADFNIAASGEAKFVVDFHRTDIEFDGFRIPVPPKWELLRGWDRVEILPDYCKGKTIRYFYQGDWRGDRKEIVFQVGGGTYDFR